MSRFTEARAAGKSPGYPILRVGLGRVHGSRVQMCVRVHADVCMCLCERDGVLSPAVTQAYLVISETVLDR